jgi:hypothetical protein
MRSSILALIVLALAPGMTLPPLTLTDQHDVAVTVGPETRVIVFTRDMDAGDIVKDALAEHAELLGAAQAVYVSDISRMPSLIAKLFALPAMRKRPYRMLLDRDGKATADFPSSEGQVTVMRLTDLRVESVERVGSAAALRAALAAVATPAP